MNFGEFDQRCTIPLSALDSGEPTWGSGLELSPLTDIRTLETVPRLTVADVLQLPPFAGASAVAGRQGLERHVEHANVMQIPTARFARAGDLVVATDEALRRAPTGAGRLLEMLDDRGVAAVAARRMPLRELHTDLVDAANARGVTLIELPASTHVSEVLGGTLEALAAGQASQLRRVSAMREDLGAFVLAGGELDELPGAVANLTGAEIAIVAADGVLLAASAGAERARAAAVAEAWLRDGRSDGATVGHHWIVWPVLAGRVRLGCIVARFREPPDAVQLAALEYGGNSVALELLQRREATEADARAREGFVSDLVSESLIEESRLRRTTAFGWAPDDRFVVVVARGRTTSPRELAQRARDAVPLAGAAVRRGLCLAIAPLRPGPVDVGHALAEALTRADDAHAGLSSDLESAADLPRGLREAEEALHAAEVFGARRRAYGRTELGFRRLLSEVPREELAAFVTDALAPLDAVEPDPDGPLRRTFTELLATGLNLAETARRGGWHYNTVRYRLRRLEDALGPFMEDGVLLQTLSLALMLRRELSSGGAMEPAVPLRLGDHPPAA